MLKSKLIVLFSVLYKGEAEENEEAFCKIKSYGTMRLHGKINLHEKDVSEKLQSSLRHGEVV